MQIIGRKRRKYLLFPLIMGVFSCNFLNQSEFKEPTFNINFVDVGQGDATLLQSPTGESALIDAGAGSKNLKKFLVTKKVNSLKWVLISHADGDHYAGLAELLGNISIGKIYLPNDTSLSAGWAELLGNIKLLKIPTDTLYFGDKVLLGKDGALDILWPLYTLSYQGNNSSTVALFQYGSSRVLFPGDIETEVEYEISNLGILPQVDILKVAHHGSASSSNLPFLSQLSPAWAVISCDSSVYGHPHPQTDARLKQIMESENNILRTDVLGSLTFEIGLRGVTRSEY